jgi:hypothetical protein
LYREWEEDACPKIYQNFLWSRPSPIGVGLAYQ